MLTDLFSTVELSFSFLLLSASQTGALDLSPILHVSVVSQENLSSILTIKKNSIFTYFNSQPFRKRLTDKSQILILVKEILCQSSWSWLSELNSARMNVFNLSFLLDMQVN